MRIVALDELTDDMVLAKALYENFDRVLLDEGVSGLSRYKERLRRAGVRYLYVEDRVSAGIEIDEVVSAEVRMEGWRIAGDVLRGVIADKSLADSELKKWVREMIDEVFANPASLVQMVELRRHDGHLYRHSVSVAVLSIVIGRAMQYGERQLKYMGIGAILHDIGILLLPEALQRRDHEAMDEEEQKIYRMHPQVGYEVLNAVGGVDAFSKTVVWRHHERLDGSGYPCGVDGGKLPEMVRIVSVCDAYDTLLNRRRDGTQTPHGEVIEQLLGACSAGALDARIVQQLLKHIAPFPVGSTVVLSDGRTAIVERQNENFPMRPVLRVAEGEAICSLDLLAENDLVIERLL